MLLKAGILAAEQLERVLTTAVEYKAVTTPRNFISLVSPFFSHLGIWSWKRLFGLHKELQLILQSGL